MVTFYGLHHYILFTQYQSFIHNLLILLNSSLPSFKGSFLKYPAAAAYSQKVLQFCGRSRTDQSLLLNGIYKYNFSFEK